MADNVQKPSEKQYGVLLNRSQRHNNEDGESIHDGLEDNVRFKLNLQRKRKEPPNEPGTGEKADKHGEIETKDTVQNVRAAAKPKGHPMPEPGRFKTKPPSHPEIVIKPKLDQLTDSGFSPDSIQPRAQVYLKAIDRWLLLILPIPTDRLDSTMSWTWQKILQELSQCLSAGQGSWRPEARVILVVGDRLLNNTQLQDVKEILAARNLGLSRVLTSRSETAVAAVKAGYSVEQQVSQFN